MQVNLTHDYSLRFSALRLNTSIIFYTILKLVRKRGVNLKNQSSNENIGKRVAHLRKQHHLSQAQLAEQIGSTGKHISEIERGKTGISIDTQVQLGEALHCSLDYLIKGDEFRSVDSLLPKSIAEILLSQDVKEINLLLNYLSMYEQLRNSEIKEET